MTCRKHRGANKCSLNGSWRLSTEKKIRRNQGRLPGGGGDGISLETFQDWERRRHSETRERFSH